MESIKKIEIDEKNIQSLLENGPRLLNLPEFDKFSFDIDLDNSRYAEFAALFKEKDEDGFYEKAIPEAQDILKDVFTVDKKNAMLNILGEIKNKYHDNAEILFIAEVSRFFLKTKEHFFPPLVIEKLIKDIGVTVEKKHMDFLRKAHDLILAGDLEGAKQIFIKTKQDNPEHWDGPAGLAQIFWQLGEKEKARDEIKNALRITYKCWQERPGYLAYELVEAIEQMADFILSHAEEKIISRCLNYIYGLLFEAGAASFEEIFAYLYSMHIIKMCPFIDKESLKEAMAKDDRFKIKKDYIYLSAVKDIGLLLSERKRRGADTVFKQSLSEAKLRQEGRFEEILSDREKEIDADLRNLTDSKWCIVSAGWVMRRDIKGSAGISDLISSVAGLPHSREMINLLSEIWEDTPRWDLGGRSPVDFTKYIEENGLSARALINPFAIKSHKVGRNNLCSCRSGKKYKRRRGA